MKKIILMTVFALSLGACTSSFTTAGGGDFKLPNINGTTFDSAADAKGKPLFMVFMATYCPHCKHSVPQVVEIQNTFAPKGLKVVGIFGDDTLGEPAKYAVAEKTNFDILYNGGNVAGDFGVSGVPHFVLLDKNHNIVKMWTGYSASHNFAEEINKVL